MSFMKAVDHPKSYFFSPKEKDLFRTKYFIGLVILVALRDKKGGYIFLFLFTLQRAKSPVRRARDSVPQDGVRLLSQ